MNTITQRELNRKPSLASNLRPGESVEISDRKGGLILTRRKRRALTADDMEADLKALAPHCPQVDTLGFLQEGE